MVFIFCQQVGKIMFCFKQSFSRLTRKLSQPIISNNNQYEDNLFTFDVTLEIKEDDGKGGLSRPSWLCANITVKCHFTSLKGNYFEGNQNYCTHRITDITCLFLKFDLQENVKGQWTVQSQLSIYNLFNSLVYTKKCWVYFRLIYAYMNPRNDHRSMVMKVAMFIIFKSLLELFMYGNSGG